MGVPHGFLKGGHNVAKKKGKKKGRKNPGTMAVTNPKKKGKGKKKRRNPRGFLARSFDKLGKDAALALPNLGGRYIGEAVGVLGASYLDDVTAGFGSPAAQILVSIGLGQFAPNTATWRQVRIGLLSETIHQVAVENLGFDLPAMALEAIGPAKAPTVAEEEAPAGGAAGTGALFTGVPELTGADVYR